MSACLQANRILARQAAQSRTGQGLQTINPFVADGLFTRDGLLMARPEVSLQPLAELFRARVIAFLIMRKPFSVKKLQVTEASRANPEGSILYRSGMSPKIRAISRSSPLRLYRRHQQHIPDKRFLRLRERLAVAESCKYSAG